MRKLWQETRDQGCKTAVNWVSKSIRRIIRKKTFEQWEAKLANTELTPQEIWPTANDSTKGAQNYSIKGNKPIGSGYRPQAK
jgi:hypothetical protein